MAIEVEEIRNRTDFIHLNYDDEAKVLTIESDLRPEILDNNFNDLEGRINELDKKIAEVNQKMNKILFNYTKIK